MEKLFTCFQDKLIALICLLAQSILLIISCIPLTSSACQASQHAPYFYLFTSFPPYPVPPSVPAPLTSYITLAMDAAAGLLPSAGRPPKGESTCHSRLIPCQLTDPFPLVQNLSVSRHGPDREGDAIPSHCHSGGLTRKTVIYTFNLPDSVRKKQQDAALQKEFGISVSSGFEW